MTVLSVENLTLSYRIGRHWREVVHNVSFTLKRGEMLAFVGESGSGKTTTAQAIIGLLADNARRDSGKIVLNGEEISQWSAKRLNSLRGARISLVPQDPGNSLNPVKTIGAQVGEVLNIHQKITKTEQENQVLALLTKVGLSHPAQRMKQYPHQLSGGMGQRVMLAIALINDPQWLIADEPTSALDFDMREQVLGLIERLVEQRNMGLILISHDLQQVAHYCERVLVMYKGELLDELPADQLAHATHPYTHTLWSCRPSKFTHGERLPVLDRALLASLKQEPNHE